jgi:hypothetical protein
MTRLGRLSNRRWRLRRGTCRRVYQLAAQYAFARRGCVLKLSFSLPVPRRDIVTERFN